MAYHSASLPPHPHLLLGFHAWQSALLSEMLTRWYKPLFSVAAHVGPWEADVLPEAMQLGWLFSAAIPPPVLFAPAQQHG